jgi:hypothetical protein
VGRNTIWDEMLSSGTNIIIWSLCYHVEQMLSCWWKCYHVLPSGQFCAVKFAAKIMLSSGVIYVVLSCDVIMWDDNIPLFIIPENITHS